MPNGQIKTLPPDGTDITAAVVAAGTNSSQFIKYTDKSGVFSGHPSIVKNPRLIKQMTYDELLELSSRGATILHPNAIIAVRKQRIPIRIKNTDRPKDKGTLIVPEVNSTDRKIGSIIGITGQKGFSIIGMKKAEMENEVGFICNFCQVIKKHNLSIEHIPSSKVTISIALKTEDMETNKKALISDLKNGCRPDKITVEKNIAIICVVGHTIANTPSVAARAISAVALAGIPLRILSLSTYGVNIIIGVDENNYKLATRAIHNKFFR